MGGLDGDPCVRKLLLISSKLELLEVPNLYDLNSYGVVGFLSISFLSLSLSLCMLFVFTYSQVVNSSYMHSKIKTNNKFF